MINYWSSLKKVYMRLKKVIFLMIKINF